jgi:pyruvate dehydrogenase E2 component (dihydrolipoamide acetyltransferase)
MATLITLPKLSATMTEATVVAWPRGAGDRVAAGDVILEVETDKATVTIEAPAAGVLGTPKLVAGGVARVGQPLIYILGENEREPTAAAEEGPSSGGPAQSETPASAEPATVGSRVRASPLARRLAREHGIDLHRLQGSGPSGRILREDIEVGALDVADDRVRARRHIAAQVSASRRDIPAFAASRWIDLEAMVAEIARHERQRSATDYFLLAIARAIDEVTPFRCVWDNSSMTARDLLQTNIGVVVDTGAGILIPTLADVGRLELSELAERRKAAVAAARTGRLSETLLAPTSVSLSSLIREGADEFEAIISPDQTAIVAVGRLMERVVPHHGQVAIRRGCMVTLSADHRHIDGGAAARFIGVIARVLEQRVGS